MDKYLEAKVKAARKMVVHSGTAHMDDYLCCAIARAAGFVGKIERRDPFECEIPDDGIIVCDVGKVNHPGVLTWDHHQDKDLPAAFELLARSLGIWLDLTACYPWITAASRQDVVGPVSLVKEAGYDPAVLDLLPPVQPAMLQLWAKHAGDTIGEEILSIGVGWIKASFEVQNFWKTVRHYDAYGHSVVDVRFCPPETRPIQRQLMSKWQPELLVTPSDRGPGFNLCSTPGNHVDFTKYNGPVTYNGGWILVLPESASADLTSNGPEGILRQLFQ